MLLIHCPYCQEDRAELEFRNGDEAHIIRPENIAEISDADRKTLSTALGIREGRAEIYDMKGNSWGAGTQVHGRLMEYTRSGSEYAKVFRSASTGEVLARWDEKGREVTVGVGDDGDGLVDVVEDDHAVVEGEAQVGQAAVVRGRGG